ncbi:MAG TPA: hypothetical protein ENI99_03990 [Sedimenticola sp.]|nr:hypothetical protein [Sedimenticola sp.]
MLPSRLTWIDETNRNDHFFLEESDNCLFFGEYFAGKGYQGGDTNQLIINFKCKPSDARRNPRRLYYKNKAINEIAAGLRGVFPQESAERYTWVPIPPSKVIGHEEYDGRLLQTMHSAFRNYNADIRPILRQTQSTEADHSVGNRLTPDDLYAILEIDQEVYNSAPLRQGIILFDDVITTGKHFKCCERRLREVVPPDFPIYGLFVARRILPDPIEHF